MSESRPTEDFEQARKLFIDGLACFEAGRFDFAEQRFVASLVLLPGRVSTLINLAATRLALARPQEALDVADEVLAVEPDNPEALFHRGNALGALGRQQEALASYDKLLALDPGLAQAWSNRGGILREMNRFSEAGHAFEQAIAHGADAELNAYYLAAVGAQPAPAAAPAHYVESLFDGYANQFEQHLVQVLHYRAHGVLTKNLEGLAQGRFASALDLGCGTGLCGPLVRPMAARLTGVDISSRMIDKARALGVYEHLVHADLLDYLRTSGESFDLVLAADVFTYIGELSPVFGAVHKVMGAAGVFCFSTELGGRDGHDFELLPSLRYAHSERYLRALAAQHGFELVKLLRQAIREDQRHAIEGLYVYLVRR